MPRYLPNPIQMRIAASRIGMRRVRARHRHWKRYPKLHKMRRARISRGFTAISAKKPIGCAPARAKVSGFLANCWRLR
jgi:hypothetical protein